MKYNPFTSSTFETIWSRHFSKGKQINEFNSIKGVNFIKHSYLPLFINVGENLTKGVFYTVEAEHQDYKGKTFLVYDVPAYFDIESFKVSKDSSLRLKKVFQYKGFLMDLSQANSAAEYINMRFSSKNRREFRSNQRKLETCFNIKYSFLHGQISQRDFDIAFKKFYELLNKRFAGKKTNYHHLSKEKWSYYKELVFEMLKEKKASMLIIYNESAPIGMTLNFHSEDVLFETITVFDPDYYKFSIGKISIIKLLEWCFENNYKFSDFSKGDFDYKRKWGNLEYDFEYHIFYDSQSLKSRSIANLVERYFKFKLYLRNKNIFKFYRKTIFKLTGSRKIATIYDGLIYESLESVDESQYSRIKYNTESYIYLAQLINTFLFANPESADNIKVFQSLLNKKEFVISGSKKSQKITFS
ncbi:hypothetical protein A9Q87_11990 [Flavobacteriales bacterium 34_180_T64]|nr:hypothetical protein A9Q87_11990 [Flavobacteriales bacterium 34_180_T64]